MELYGDEFNICPHCGFVVGSVPEEPIHMVPGTVLHDRYIIGKVLGFGGFGVTYIAWDKKLEQKVAIKEYLPGEFSTRMPGQTFVTVFNGEKTEQYYNGLKKFVDEAKRLAKFQNEEGIVKIFDSFEDNNTAYIVMEYLEGETLAEYLKRNGTIPEEQAVEMLRPVMESLITVHEAGIIHRDIAPENIFLTTSGEVKLIDFGASRYATTTHSRSLTVIVNSGYSPEEQYRSRGDQGTHTDVYALGATLYKMITGKTPPDAMERRAKYEHENKDILEEPHKLTKDISVNREIAILNALNVRIEDRTPDIITFIDEINADPPAKRRHGKIRKIDVYAWPLWLKLTVPSLLVLLITFGALLISGVINFSKYSREVVIPDNIVIVPDVEGMEKNDALKQVADAKLLGLITGSIESEYIAAGKIIIQRPVGGTFLEKNGTISLVVCEGSGVAAPVEGKATIPYLIGNDREKAIEKCRMAGLGDPVFEEIEDEDVAAGLVISSDLAEGEQVPEGTVLHLKVSKGPTAFSMPETVGQDEIAARTHLEESGLMYMVEYEYSETIPEGQVIRQSVPATQDVRRGDKITLVVSSGEKLVTVENIVGRTQAEAVKILEEQGFAVYVRENTDEKIAAGSIVSQSPEANSSQKKGSTITIFVSTGKKVIHVSLDSNGGTGVPGDMVVHLEEPYSGLSSPSRTGYSFDGWYTSQTGGSLVTTNTVVTKSSDHTLYAHWTANNYMISLNGNGGSVSSSSKTITFDTTYGDLPTPSRNGYTFDGWYNGGTKVNSSTKMTTASDHSIDAHWIANSYNVSFNANGGSVPSSSKSIAFDSTYGTLPTPSYEGYIFTGWYTDPDGGSMIDSSTTVTSTADHTLYAHWSAGNCKVTLNPNGGKVSSTVIGVTYNGTYGELPSATKEGYSFYGWYTAASGGMQVSSTTKVTKTTDHTLYAQWMPNFYTVTFNGNGGKGSESSKSVAYDSSYGELPSASRTGYSFSGWYTSASGGTQVSSATQVTKTADHTLYAHWTPNRYTITFDGNGGKGTQSSKQVAYDSAYGDLPSASRDYYEFDGWYTAASGGTKISSSSIMSGDITVYAHWKIHPTSDWVKADDIPAGAQIVESKWTYTLIEYMEITSEELKNSVITTDWILYDVMESGYGQRRGPFDSEDEIPDRDGLHVWSDEIWDDSENYVYYHRYDDTGTFEEWGTDTTLRSGARHEITLKYSPLYYRDTYRDGNDYITRYEGFECPHCGATTYWFEDTDYKEPHYKTVWYWEEIIYTYYYYKESEVETTSSPFGKTFVSSEARDIQEYVKYRAK